MDLAEGTMRIVAAVDVTDMSERLFVGVILGAAAGINMWYTHVYRHAHGYVYRRARGHVYGHACRHMPWTAATATNSIH